MSLFLWINILIIAGLLLLSFDKKLRFYKQWKTLIPSILFVVILFVFWGRAFSKAQILGLNPNYLTGISYFDIPIEEYLILFTTSFFFSFIYEEIKSHFFKFRPVQFSYYFSLTFTLLAIILALVYHDKWYTFAALMIAGVLNWIIYFGYTPKWYPYFIIAFLVALIPFLFVEGLLLGMITENSLTWYNPNEIIGFKILSVPIEEFFFFFLMNFSVIVIHEFLKKRWVK